MDNFIISTTPTLEGRPIMAYLGVVNTNIVLGTNVFSDFAASFTDFFGGNSETYQRKMDLMYDEAKAEIKDKAKRLGANAVVGLRMDFDELSGKGKSMFMLSVTATACIIDDPVLKQKNITRNELIDSYELQLQTKLSKLISRLNSEPIMIGDDDWSTIAETNSLDVIRILAKDYYTTWLTDTRERFENLLSSIDYNDAVQIIYPLYFKSYHEDGTISNNFEEKREESDVISSVDHQYARLIGKTKLINYQIIEKMIATDMKRSLMIIDYDKATYSKEDLEAMKRILLTLDNLPNRGEKTIGKGGMFSNKEKEIFVCQNGHKNDADQEYCSVCMENIKGLNKEEVEKIERLRTKVEILSSLFEKV